MEITVTAVERVDSGESCQSCGRFPMRNVHVLSDGQRVGSMCAQKITSQFVIDFDEETKKLLLKELADGQAGSSLGY